MTIDWKDLRHIGRMRAFMVAPNNLELVIGEIEGIDWSKAKVSAAYYSAARTSASITVIGDSWIRNTFIRLVYEVPDLDYTREIGTYLVTNDNSVRRNGVWQTTLEMHSMLYGLSVDLSPNNSTIVGNTTSNYVIKSELEEAGRDYAIDSANDYLFTNPVVFESGKSRLSRINALCSTSGNRVDVNGHGIVTISPYIAPSQKTPQYTLELSDPRGIVKDGISRSSNFLELPNQAVVSYKFTTTDENGNSSEGEIVAVVSASDSTGISLSQRGYNVTHFASPTDITPPTYERAEQIAIDNLKANANEKVEWQLSTKFVPTIWEGEVIALDIPDGLSQYRGLRKCLVKNMEISGPYWDMSLTLKEVGSGDDEEQF